MIPGPPRRPTRQPGAPVDARLPSRAAAGAGRLLRPRPSPPRRLHRWRPLSSIPPGRHRHVGPVATATPTPQPQPEPGLPAHAHRRRGHDGHDRGRAGEDRLAHPGRDRDAVRARRGRPDRGQVRGPLPVTRPRPQTIPDVAKFGEVDVEQIVGARAGPRDRRRQRLHAARRDRAAARARRAGRRRLRARRRDGLRGHRAASARPSAGRRRPPRSPTRCAGVRPGRARPSPASRSPACSTRSTRPRRSTAPPTTRSWPR